MGLMRCWGDGFIGVIGLRGYGVLGLWVYRGYGLLGLWVYRGAGVPVCGPTCVTPCCPCPAPSLGTAVMILAGVPLPDVITLVVMMVMGDLMPGLLVTPGGQGGGGAWGHPWGP